MNYTELRSGVHTDSSFRYLYCLCDCVETEMKFRHPATGSDSWILVCFQVSAVTAVRNLTWKQLRETTNYIYLYSTIAISAKMMFLSLHRLTRGDEANLAPNLKEAFQWLLVNLLSVLSLRAVNVWPWFFVASFLKRLKLAKSLMNYTNFPSPWFKWIGNPRCYQEDSMPRWDLNWKTVERVQRMM